MSRFQFNIYKTQYYLAIILIPAALIGTGIGWATEEVGIGRWAGTVLGVAVWWLVILMLLRRNLKQYPRDAALDRAPGPGGV